VEILERAGELGPKEGGKKKRDHVVVFTRGELTWVVRGKKKGKSVS